MTTTAQNDRKSMLLAIILTCVGYGFFNINDAGLKMVTARLHFSQVMFTSACIVFCFMGIYGWFKEGKKAFQTKKPKLILVRALLAQVTTLCNVIAFPHIQLTTFYTLVFTVPLWVALFSSYFLKDNLNKQRLGTILFGFFVIVYIFRPGGDMFNIWAGLILFSSLAYSLQMVLVRHIGPQESRPFMFMCGFLTTMIMVAPFLPEHYEPITRYEGGLFLMMGVSATIGLLCISYAFQTTPSASIIAPYHYTQIIWGALIGYYIFKEVPSMETLIGAALLILSGLYLIHCETRKPKTSILEDTTL